MRTDIDAGRARLTRGQALVLAAATLPMVAAGGFGAWGTYTNIVTEFGRAATALGVVAAGEGVTLVLALVMVGLTMLGQSAPAPVRMGLWGAPLAAALTGLAVADNATEAVVYAMTPMAMCASAEGLGLLARRIVVHRTGVDMEAQRRNAETVQRLAYHRARAANHPSEGARRRSERASWRLAKRVGVGDAELGGHLVEVQRERLREGADAALADMFGAAPELPAVEPIEERPAIAPQPVPEVARPARPVICAGPGRTLPLLLRRPASEVTVERVDVDQPEPLEVTAPELEATGPAPTWESETRAAVDWVFNGGDSPMPTRTVGPNDKPLAAPKVDLSKVEQVVTRLDFDDFTWKPAQTLQLAAAQPAERPRQVVTEKVADTPSELRRKARRLHKQVVAETGRAVTIERLREEFGLSRRDAAKLRREVVEEGRS